MSRRVSDGKITSIPSSSSSIEHVVPPSFSIMSIHPAKNIGNRSERPTAIKANSESDSGAKNEAKHTPKDKGKFAEKYKYVRFVEKKKVLRKMRQLQQSLLTFDSVDKVEVEKQLAELRKDLMYIDKFPGDKKYISLFPTGQLSSECVKKQAEIRAMILNLTNRRDSGSNRNEKLDVINRDDFFASVDNIEKPSAKPVPVETPAGKSCPQSHRKPMREKSVHPSWEAKKMNEKLTGSLAGRTFAGSRTVFGEDDDE